MEFLYLVALLRLYRTVICLRIRKWVSPRFYLIVCLYFLEQA
ncbi:hypothetical protein SAMN05421799_1061 [Alicyclobacillus vulcanalis]|uniref:Uncharacterized protein n=1 Tax=Alicyclobacillus vulcanalis TaxID=252246 RepID=A0A1N7MNZ7_9BACL|nr:hypothetical protein SAMN05421799_1061 [Alicyclobacillus vulcanalis]